jgi:hypothetical protein
VSYEDELAFLFSLLLHRNTDVIYFMKIKFHFSSQAKWKNDIDEKKNLVRFLA